MIIHSPLFIELGKKPKRYHLNLNGYRNWHYQVSNNLKKKYSSIIAPQILDLRASKIKLELTLWKKTKRITDRANVLSIHEKFFCDALVNLGCIDDDNDNYIESSFYSTGGVDPHNPRVDIKVTVIE